MSMISNKDIEARIIVKHTVKKKRGDHDN